MPLNPSSVQSLRRVFNEGFSVHDIAEPLVSFDASTSAADVRAFMDQHGHEVVGARQDGLVVGFVERGELGDGICREFLRSFEESHVVLASAPLADIILRLNERPRLFVSVLGRVGGIVDRGDLQKPPLRMWLFGVVTLIEMRFTRMIERFCPDGSWKQFLSEARTQKAEELLAERSRRNQQLDLLDCLQFSDKGQICARSEQLRGLTQFQSRRQIEDVVKRIERLRNNLAHAQDIITTDWNTIVQLSENLDRVLEGPPGLRDSEWRTDRRDAQEERNTSSVN